MGANEIVTMITNLGFPIFVSVVLLKYIKTREDKHDAERIEERKERKDESQMMSTAINNNTLTVQKLIDKIDGGGLING